MARRASHRGVSGATSQQRTLVLSLPKVRGEGWVEYKNPRGGGNIIDVFPFSLSGWEIGGEEMADALKELIGDGCGKVSVGVDMSEKDYGNGFGCSVMVSLTCDQSAEGMFDAAGEAGEIGKTLLREKYEEMAREFEKVRPNR